MKATERAGSRSDMEFKAESLVHSTRLAPHGAMPPTKQEGSTVNEGSDSATCGPGAATAISTAGPLSINHGVSCQHRAQLRMPTM